MCFCLARVIVIGTRDYLKSRHLSPAMSPVSPAPGPRDPNDRCIKFL